MTAKKAKVTEKQLQLIEMALRQILMAYFKDTSGNNVVNIENGLWINYTGDRQRYRYQRQLSEMHRPADIILVDTVLCSLQRSPNKLTFAVKPERSPEMAYIVRSVKRVLRDYLPSVEVVDAPSDAQRGIVDDVGRFNAVDVSVRVPRGEREYTVRPGYTFTTSESENAFATLEELYQQYVDATQERPF